VPSRPGPKPGLRPPAPSGRPQCGPPAGGPQPSSRADAAFGFATVVVGGARSLPEAAHAVAIEDRDEHPVEGVAMRHREPSAGGPGRRPSVSPTPASPPSFSAGGPFAARCDVRRPLGLPDPRRRGVRSRRRTRDTTVQSDLSARVELSRPGPKPGLRPPAPPGRPQCGPPAGGSQPSSRAEAAFGSAMGVVGAPAPYRRRRTPWPVETAGSCRSGRGQ
jgi:translation initiation factor IF-2